MSNILKGIEKYLSHVIDDTYLEHKGTPQRFPGDPNGSGRYREGSGKNPYQHSNDFLGRVERLKSKGWKETPENIQKEFGLTTTQYRIEKSICLDERKGSDISKAKALKKKGLSTSEIGRRMGVNESTVRGWFNQEQKARYAQAKKTADFLKSQVDKKKMIDVGKNVELDMDVASGLNVSREKLDTALYLLERQGYHVYKGRVPQPTNKDQMTTLKVLAAPDVQHKEIYNYDKIQTINEYITKDKGETYVKKFTYPASLDSKRVKVYLKDEKRPDGLVGSDLDGVIELRRGVEDLDLKGSRYAQVRILVDNNKYLKGMAIYSDDIPKGYDVVFNSNKLSREDAFKKIKDDPDNPFGAAIKEQSQGGQYWYTDKNGNKKLGLINKTRDEGDWEKWQDGLSTQFLAKQPKNLAEKQLNLSKANTKAEYDTIMSLTNPTIKKYYLEKFANTCDAAAVDLKAASLPGQKYHAILPINSLKDNEVYAPRYRDGSEVALIRYPHGGLFEIPILKVNNKNANARKIIGSSAIDAVGINKNVADRLSGADFDGDFVMVIPTNDKKGKVKIKNAPRLKELVGFETDQYKYDEIRKDSKGRDVYYRNGRRFNVMSNTDTEMGKISNLITDMTIQGATSDELARAVKHSMVVIDAEKHKLNYQQSYKDNNIEALQRKYQPKYNDKGELIGGGGASTIFSRAKGEKKVLKRKGQPRINIKGKAWYDPSKPEGSLLYTQADDVDLYYTPSKIDKKNNTRTLETIDGKTITYKMNDSKAAEKYRPIMKRDSHGQIYFTNKEGKVRYKYTPRTINSTNMAETDDANTLVSTFRHPKELLYAEYANYLKNMANQARKDMVYTKNLRYDPQAKKIYAKEVSSLNIKLNNAKKNSIKERTAIRLANKEINDRMKDNPNMKPNDVRKLSQRSITKYREQVGSESRRERSIKITDKEWEAIQAGAISENKLKEILNNSDADSLREKAMPKKTSMLSSPQISRIKAMNASGFTIAEIADKMNISSSSVSKYLKGV